MDLSRKWLADFTDIAAGDQEYIDRMTISGSKVETLHRAADEIKNVVVGKVTSIERHPDSDHMWITQVDVGTEEDVQIVTGAQNVKVGDLVPAALHKSLLPGGKKIEKGKLRGVVSNGMLCSLSELGLDKHDFPYAIEDGIFIIEEDCKPGDDICKVIGADDSIIEFEITNNRPDCLSVIGLARESAVTFGTELKLHTPEVKGCGGDIHELLTVEIKNPDLCPRYTGKMIKNIKIEPSPLWMRQRLRSAGVRPINNIVDITNYVMLEYGQPMHAFDYACLEGGKIIVRNAAEGETIDTLDGTSRQLNPDMLVIADANKPVGVAGVMGGANSEITENTKYAVFESANFNGINIRKTGIALNMRTDASGRYEKGLDAENTYPAVMRACELVEMLGAGEVIDGTVDIIAKPKEATKLSLDADKINRLLGTDIPVDFMVKTLEGLGFTVEDGIVTVPSWRADVEHYSDLAEEVARFWGYNVIEPTMFKGEAVMGGYTAKQSAENLIGIELRAMGYSEIYTYSFVSPNVFDKIQSPDNCPRRKYIKILNPLGEDTSVMRTTSLPSMLETLARNRNFRNENVRLYELAKIYTPVEGNDLPDEHTVITLGGYGNMDFFELKGVVEALLERMNVEDVRFVAFKEIPCYHPGRCALIFSGDRPLGAMGQIHPTVAENYDLGECYAAEIEFNDVLAARQAEATYQPLPKFPTVARDIAVVCDEKITIDELIACIKRGGGNLLRDVALFDIYTGVHIEEGKKSCAFNLKLRSDEKTLTDEESDAEVAGILSTLEKELGAVIR